MTLNTHLLVTHGNLYLGRYYLNDRTHQHFSELNQTLGLIDNGDDSSIPQNVLHFVQCLIRENDGNTMLHLAVIAGNAPLVSALLNSALNPFLRNKDGKTAVQLAMEHYAATLGNVMRRAHFTQILRFFVNQQCLIGVNGELPRDISLLRQVAMGNLVSEHETAQENIFNVDSFNHQSDPLVGRWGAAAMDEEALARIKYRLHQYWIANYNNNSIEIQADSTLALIIPILEHPKLAEIPLPMFVSSDEMHIFPDDLTVFSINAVPVPNEIEVQQANAYPADEVEIILADMTTAAQIAALKKAYDRLLTDGRAVAVAEYKTVLEEEQHFLRTYLRSFSHSGFLSLSPQQLALISRDILLFIAFLSSLLYVVLLGMSMIPWRHDKKFGMLLLASSLLPVIVLCITLLGGRLLLFISYYLSQKSLRELFTPAAKAEKITADLTVQLLSQYPGLPEVLNLSVLKTFGEERLVTVTESLERISARSAQQIPPVTQKNQVGFSEQARFFKILDRRDSKIKSAKIAPPLPDERGICRVRLKM